MTYVTLNNVKFKTQKYRWSRLMSLRRIASNDLQYNIHLLYSIVDATLVSLFHKIKYAGKIFPKALAPMTKFPDLHHPSYYMTLIALVWIVGVVGAIHHKYEAMRLLAFIASLTWKVEVLGNIVNVTVSRVITLFYPRGILHSNIYISLQRAAKTSLGSINLGSFLVPILEAMRVLVNNLTLKSTIH